MSRHIQDDANARYPAVSVNGRDYKAWAKRIVYREEQGDKAVTPIQIKFAREALDMVKQKPQG